LDISTEVLRRSLHFFLHCDGNIKKIFFVGGEPFTKIDLLDEAWRMINLLRKEFAHKTILTTINTNGTILNDRILRFIKHLDYIAVSLDGREPTHNLHRRYHNGRGTFNKVLRNFNRIKKTYPQKLIINKIVTSRNVYSVFEDTLFLAGLKPKFIFLNVALGDLGWSNKKVDALFRNADKLYRWIKGRWKNRSIREMFQLLFKPVVHECPMTHVSIDTDGKIYPCEILLSRKEDTIGNLILDYIRPDIVYCEFSANDERCAKELCRECNQICRKVYFDSWPRKPYSQEGLRWLEQAMGFQSFFWRQHKKDSGISVSGGGDMLRSALESL